MKILPLLLKRNNTIILLLILLIYPLSHYAQNKFSIEQVMSAGFYSNLVASKDSNFVAWVENKKGARNIFISDGKSTKKVTDFNLDDGQEISNLIIGPNQAFILFVRGGAPNRNGEIPNPLSLADKTKREIWKVDLKNNKLSLISEGSSPSLANDGQKLAFIKKGEVWYASLISNDKPNLLFTIRGRVSNLNWSPDSEKLAFVSGRFDHSFIGIYEQRTKTISYLSPSVDYDRNPVWSKDSKQLAFIRIPREKHILPFMPRRSALPWSIFVTQIENKTAHQIWKAPKGQGSAFRSISADKQLFWAANERLIFPWEGDGFTNMYSIRTDGSDLKLISPGLSEIQFASLSNNGHEFVYSSNYGDVDRQHIWNYSILAEVNKQITKGEGIEWSPVLTNNGKLFMLASGPERSSFPAILVNSELHSLQMPSDLNEFPKNSLVKPEQVIFSAADGMQIHGQLFLPKNMKKGKKYPALLFFHGGSRRQMLLGFHHRGYYHNAYAFNQYLANHGYIVLSVNYRSGIGYGMEFREALNYGARGASEFQDVLGAGLYLRNRHDVNPNKIGLWGGSYGGFLTAMGLAKASNLFAAGVDLHGVHNWNFVIKNFRQNYNPAENAEVAELAYKSSPAAYVKDWRSPVLLIQGDDDRNVPFSETVNIVEALRKHNVEFEQLIFPDEVHGFLLHKSWLKAYNASFNFFEDKLKN